MSADRFMTIRNPMYGSGQNVAYTGTAGTVTNSLPAGCNSVWVLCTTAAYVRVGAAPTATTSDFPVAANVGVVLPLPGDKDPQDTVKVSAVQVSSGGTLYMIPLAE